MRGALPCCPCLLLPPAGVPARSLLAPARVGLEVEQSFGSPQDIEGVVEEDGSITVVQTRPQVH